MTPSVRFYVVFLGLSLSIAASLPAQSSGEIPQTAIDKAALVAADSVVQIETVGNLDQAGQQLSNSGPTTGTVLSEEGWIIASSFNFEPAPAAIVVRTKDGNRQTAKLIARDRHRELVLLKTEANSLLRGIEPADIASLKVGQTAIALGKVFDPARPSVSVGIVSAKGRIWGKAVQTDARISPTNYGGPLIDLQGRCIGILAPINPGDGSPEDGTQWYDSGIGFAASIEQILRGLDTLKSGKDIVPGRLGVTLSTQDDYSGPVFVAGAAASSPAANIGLKRGDRILEINGAPIELLSHLKLQLGSLNAGDVARIKIQRAAELLDLSAILVDKIPPYRLPYLGIVPAFGAKDQAIIKQVLSDSPASKIGLMAGDRIVEFNGTPVATTRELTDVLQTQAIDKPLTIRTQRGDDPIGQPTTLILEAWPSDPIVSLTEDEKLAAAAAQNQPAQNQPGTGVIELPLGDVKNKCFAFVPPNYQADIPHGLLMIIPEAGEIDQRILLDQWEPLCRSHRWIFAVLSSADAKAWSREEVELIGRTLTLIQTNYSIDPHRVTAVGIRSAAPLAIVAAFGQRTKFNGLLILGGEFPARANPPAAQPFECIRGLIVNDADATPEMAEKLSELGHPTGTIQSTVEAGGKIPAAQSEIIQFWLRGLERL